MKVLTEEQRNLLRMPLPEEALTTNPAKTFLTAIKPIYIVERLNDVFGVGAWGIKTDLLKAENDGTTLVKATLEIPEYNIHIEQFGGHTDKDLGDSAKGSATDALTKCASYLEIGIDIFKGKVKTDVPKNSTYQKPANKPQYKAANKHIDFQDADKMNTVDELLAWYNECMNFATDKQKELLKTICAKRKEKIMKGENGMNR